MRALIIGSLVFVAYLVPARWYYTCQIKGMCGKEQQNIAAASNENVQEAEAPEVLELPPRSTDLSFTIDDKEILSEYEQFGFMPNSEKAELSANNSEFLDSVVSYLKDKPDMRIALTGYYLPDEKLEEAGIYDNVGIARTAYIRDMLVEKGLELNRFKLDYKEATSDGPFIGKPMTFGGFMPEAATDETQKLVESKYEEFKEMTFGDLNFEKDSEVFKPTEAFDNYAKRLKEHLDSNANKTIMIEGHCDADGETELNRVLGLRRANNIRAYLIGAGIDGKRVEADTKGETTPTAPNDTEENKTKNRRFVLIIND